MGNTASYLWWRQPKEEAKIFVVTPKSNKDSVLRVVEEIQKLSPEDIEQQFDSLYRTSNEILRSMTHNPCGQLSDRIKTCLEENNQQMFKCFAVMEEYRSCVSELMEHKLSDVVHEYEKASGQTRLLGGAEPLKKDK